MIQEEYCSFEIAKLLKEKGFDGLCYCHAFTDYEGNSTTYHTEYPENWNQSEPCVSIPTLGMAMRWLREVHQLHISVDVCPIYGKVKDEKGRNSCGLLYWHYMASGEWLNDKYNPQQKAFVVPAKCYEEAIEAALKCCLENLI